MAKPKAGGRNPQTRTTTPPTTVPATTPNMSQVLSGLGIDPNLVAAQIALLQANTGANDPDVWDGKKIAKASEVETEFYKLDNKGLRDFQERAFRAGLYGTDDRSRVRFGDYDSDSFSIWRQLVDRSAGFQAAGKKVSPFDALYQAEQASPGIEQPKPAKPMNALDIKAAGNTIGKEVLGQGLTDQQQAKFQGAVRSFEAPYLNDSATQAAPSSAGFEQFAKDQIRALDPVRADSRSVVGAFDQIAQLMRGGN